MNTSPESATKSKLQEPAGDSPTPGLRLAWRRWAAASLDLADALARSFSIPGLFFGLGLAVYLVIRLVRLDDFPIYFFADEAVQTLFAEELIKSGFRDASGIWLPVYVEAAALRWTPLLSMYFQALTLSLFGKSIFVTRATSAVISVLAPLAVGLSLKQVFKTRTWWAGVLLLGMIPAWLLHSRTAFETVLTTTFYACFLLCYLLYRTHSPKALYAALVFAAAAFYTYSNGQVVILGAGALLFLSDLPYHWKQRRTLLTGAGLALVLALPFLLFRWFHPEALSQHLRAVNSYWFQPLTLFEKLSIFFQKVFYGLSPQYWFFPNGQDLPRHRWDHQGHILLGLLPFVLVGVLICLRNIRSAPHRVVLLSAIATPLGAALVEIGITRVLAFVIPASLFAGLGLDWTLEQGGKLLGKWRKTSINAPVNPNAENPGKATPYIGLLAVVTFVILTAGNFNLLNQALKEGPLWFSDYGLYGMQYGAKQLFEQAIPDLLAQDPQAQVLVTSTWANGADRFLNFFFTPTELKRLRVDGVQNYLFKLVPLKGNEVFIMSPAEYQEVLDSPKLTNIRLDRTLNYPDGSPGFLFVRLEYAPGAEAIFAAEKEARRRLVEAQVSLDGQLVAVRHSAIDMGAPDLIFDGDHFTLMRGLEANPFILELTFPEPRRFTQVQADFGLANITLTALLYPEGQETPLSYESRRSNSNDQDPLMSLDLSGSPAITRLRFEIFNRAAGETANIHIRELTLLP
jgi:4-amino-4-deoxy-L-arabinose transferase-like glycosyltransferase